MDRHPNTVGELSWKQPKTSADTHAPLTQWKHFNAIPVNKETVAKLIY